MGGLGMRLMRGLGGLSMGPSLDNQTTLLRCVTGIQLTTRIRCFLPVLHVRV